MSNQDYTKITFTNHHPIKIIKVNNDEKLNDFNEDNNEKCLITDKCIIGWNIQEEEKPLQTITTNVINVEIKSTRIGVLRQILVTCSVLLTASGCGMPIGFSSVLLPQLYNSTDPLNLDLEMGSWIASVHSLATPIGSFISGPLSDKIGRRPSLLLAILPLFSGWIVLALSQSHTMLLIGRIISGISVGLIAAPAQILLAEIAEPRLRGILIGAPFVSYSLGILFVYLLGSLLHWRIVAWCGIILPVFSFCTLYFMPESPVFLAQNGKIEEATKVLNWLRGGENYAKKELLQLTTRLANEKCQKRLNFFEILSKTSVIKPLIIINCFHFLLIFSGTYIVVFYAVDIISEFGNEKMDTMQAAVLTAVVRLIFTIVFCFLLLFVKRRPMVICSGIGSGLSSITLAIFTYIRLGQTKTSLDIYFSAVCILIYIGSNTGFMVMPGIMIGELLPAKIRGQIAGYIFSLFNIALFGVAKGFPTAQYYFKSHGLFFIFGCSSLFASALVFLMLPETKGQPLCEIENYFEQNNWMWITRNSHSNNINNNNNNNNNKINKRTTIK